MIYHLNIIDYQRKKFLFKKLMKWKILDSKINNYQKKNLN